ncbi:MAG: helix-turn-helix transcriptional regulator [Williamsia sp.]|nr:helix-turn-helix transcriptional regulator [Williamsia sp.]
MTSVFSFDGTAGSFQNLSVSLGGSMENETLLLDRNEFKGCVKRLELEPDLYLLYWNLDVLKDCVFINRCSPHSNLSYFLTYYFETQFDTIASFQGTELKHKRYFPSTTLYSNKLDMKYVYKAGRNIRCICIVFSDTWLKEELEAETNSGKFKSTFIARPDAAHVFTTSPTEQLLSVQLLSEYKKNSPHLSLKAYTYNLLNSFTRFTVPDLEPVSKPKPYLEVVTEVEKKLRASLTDAPPGIDQLASEFYISSSTLKRHFKQMYGKNIYQYYLEQKMQLARKMLEKDRMNVTHVATALGYESVSHFIALFKKHHGSSPNEVRKSLREQ